MKLYRNVFIFLFIVSVSVGSYGQTNKVFLNLRATDGSKIPFLNELSGIEAGYGFKTKKGNWHEFELGNIKYARRNAQPATYGTVLERYMSLRYQHIINIAKTHFTGRFQPNVGVGVNTFSYYSKTKPFSSFNYPVKYGGLLINPYAALGLQYNFKSNFFVAGSFAMPIVELLRTSTRLYYPHWTVEEQKYSEYRMDIFRFKEVNFRLGAGVMF